MQHYFLSKNWYEHTHPNMQGSLIFLVPAQKKKKVSKLILCKLPLKARWRDSPWWALICGSTLCRISRDFLWYSAWSSISYKDLRYQTHYHLPSWPIACPVMFQAAISYYITILYPKTSTCRLKGVCIVYFFGHKVVHVSWQLVLNKEKTKNKQTKKQWINSLF